MSCRILRIVELISTYAPETRTMNPALHTTHAVEMDYWRCLGVTRMNIKGGEEREFPIPSIKYGTGDWYCMFIASAYRRISGQEFLGEREGTVPEYEVREEDHGKITGESTYLERISKLN